ncbi:MAG: hypothetical protein IJT36_04125 [Alphaproteobacteria bacterium]|nr:hypothetical protein [Alphaproteobacteria bacterium]
MKPINKLLCCAAGVVTALCIDIQAMEQTAGGGVSDRVWFTCTSNKFC